MQAPETETQPRRQRLIVPVGLIALGIALSVWLSLWSRRTSSMATNSSTSLAASGGAISLESEFPPQPELSPKEVVERQMAALKAARDDALQIAACYAFASPRNRLSLGSAENLLNVIRAYYSPMISSDNVEIGESQILDREAAVTVSVISPDAAVHVYQFFLSRQTEPPYIDCWMTDAVVELKSVADPSITEPTPPT